MLYCKYSDCNELVLYILQFFLSLYGHKLPVLSMDISSVSKISFKYSTNFRITDLFITATLLQDSTLIVTASSDKNIKLWGLDFGDCHKSIFAHDDR